MTGDIGVVVQPPECALRYEQILGPLSLERGQVGNCGKIAGGFPAFTERRKWSDPMVGELPEQAGMDPSYKDLTSRRSRSGYKIPDRIDNLHRVTRQIRLNQH